MCTITFETVGTISPSNQNVFIKRWNFSGKKIELYLSKKNQFVAHILEENKKLKIKEQFDSFDIIQGIPKSLKEKNIEEIRQFFEKTYVSLSMFQGTCTKLAIFQQGLGGVKTEEREKKENKKKEKYPIEVTSTKEKTFLRKEILIKTNLEKIFADEQYFKEMLGKVNDFREYASSFEFTDLLSLSSSLEENKKELQTQVQGFERTSEELVVTVNTIINIDALHKFIKTPEYVQFVKNFRRLELKYHNLSSALENFALKVKKCSLEVFSKEEVDCCHPPSNELLYTIHVTKEFRSKVVAIFNLLHNYWQIKHSIASFLNDAKVAENKLEKAINTKEEGLVLDNNNILDKETLFEKQKASMAFEKKKKEIEQRKEQIKEEEKQELDHLNKKEEEQKKQYVHDREQLDKQHEQSIQENNKLTKGEIVQIKAIFQEAQIFSENIVEESKKLDRVISDNMLYTMNTKFYDICRNKLHQIEVTKEYAAERLKLLKQLVEAYKQALFPDERLLCKTLEEIDIKDISANEKLQLLILQIKK